MPGSTQAGDVLAGRYTLQDLLAEARDARFWRAQDSVLHRPVAVLIIGADDERAADVLAAARRMGPLSDPRVLRVLDADTQGSVCFVVSEWGQGESLDILLLRSGPLPARRAAWLVAEVAESMARAHAVGLTHGRLIPENVLIDHNGHIRIIGCGIETALHHGPPAPEADDVVALAGLLYACLTGKWPGADRSQVPSAPVEHHRILRPRQVRAGIPRQLDALCDEVLNSGVPGRATHRSQRSGHDLTTAEGLCQALTGFVGDASDLEAPAPMRPVVPVASPSAPTPAAPTPAAPTPAAPTPPLPAPPTEETPPPAALPEPDPDPVPPPSVSSVDLPTQAGMPVFHDDTDEVEWLRAHAEVPAPPPPLKPAEPRPLFAPDPPEGQPVRRPRTPAAAAAADSDYWPWDQSEASAPSSDTGTGNWSVDTWTGDHGTGTGTSETSDHVPGRSWIRLAMLVALAMVVLIAAVAAYQLGLGQPPDDDGEDPPPGAVTPAAVEAFEGLTAVDFDPQGSAPHDEYPDLVPLALDGDPATFWRTSTYKQDLGPGGLKTGVGLVVDLGGTKGVREVAVTFRGDTAWSAYVTERAPTGVADLTPVGKASGDGEVTIALDEAVSGRYVTVWLTSLPAVSDGFRGEVAEVEVRG